MAPKISLFPPAGLVYQLALLMVEKLDWIGWHRQIFIQSPSKFVFKGASPFHISCEIIPRRVYKMHLMDMWNIPSLENDPTSMCLEVWTLKLSKTLIREKATASLLFWQGEQLPVCEAEGGQTGIKWMDWTSVTCDKLWTHLLNLHAQHAGWV